MNLTITADKNKWIENFARWGYAAKGIVYCLLGVLAIIAAFGSKSTKNTGKRDVFNLILEQPFGRVLLGIVAFGLFCYVIWRLVEAIKDPHHHGKNTKGVIVRAGYIISAAIYFSLSLYAFRMIIGNGSESGGNNAEQNILSKIMSYQLGLWVVGVVAAILIGRGVQQIIQGINGKYRKDLKEGEIDSRYRNILIKAGGVGYTARGIVWGIIGFLLLRAAIHSNAGEAGSTSNAFDFIEGFGHWVLAAVAAGLICYGIFKILEALYKRIHI